MYINIISDKQKTKPVGNIKKTEYKSSKWGRGGKGGWGGRGLGGEGSGINPITFLTLFRMDFTLRPNQVRNDYANPSSENVPNLIDYS